MTQHMIPMWSQIGWMAGGAFGLLIFGLLVAVAHRPRVPPGSRGHRTEPSGEEHETIRSDGYIDSFANTIEEAGGALPPLVVFAIPAILIWWLVYLVLYI